MNDAFINYLRLLNQIKFQESKHIKIQMQEDSFQIQVLILMIILTIYILASFFIDKYKVQYIHQSTIAIVLGFITALSLRITIGKEINFSNQIFFALLLPPIIFSVGYNIKKLYFFGNFGLITILGILSSLITMGLLFSLLSFLSFALLLPLCSKDIVLLSLILSSIDPIIALPTIKQSHPKLNAILSGQSIINSAVIIILFGIVSKIKEQSNQEQTNIIGKVIVEFSYQFIFSVLLGIVLGLILSFFFKKIESFWHQPIRETSLIILNGYFVYLFGEFIGLSGNISLFTTAIVFSIYGFNNLSRQARHGTVLSFETVKFIFQAFIFAYIGVQFIKIEKNINGFIISIIIIIFLPIIRIISVFFIPISYKVIKTKSPLTNNQYKMLWYSGLTRGIINFALSLQIQSTHRSLMINISLLVVMVSTIFCSTFLKIFVNKIGLSQIGIINLELASNQQKSIQLSPATKYSVIGTNEVQIQQKAQKFQSFQQKFIKPLFIKQERQQKKLQNIKIQIIS